MDGWVSGCNINFMDWSQQSKICLGHFKSKECSKCRSSNKMSKCWIIKNEPASSNVLVSSFFNMNNFKRENENMSSCMTFTCTVKIS